MIKYAANVTLAGQVAIANELYRICKATEIDYNSVKNAILLMKESAEILMSLVPTEIFGFGGKYFPKDLNALIYLARDRNYRPIYWKNYGD